MSLIPWLADSSTSHRYVVVAELPSHWLCHCTLLATVCVVFSRSISCGCQANRLAGDFSPFQKSPVRKPPSRMLGSPFRKCGVAPIRNGAHTFEIPPFRKGPPFRKVGPPFRKCFLVSRSVLTIFCTKIMTCGMPADMCAFAVGTVLCTVFLAPGLVVPNQLVFFSLVRRVPT